MGKSWRIILGVVALLLGACTLATERVARESTLVRTQTAAPNDDEPLVSPTAPQAGSSPTALTLIPVGSPMPSPVAVFTLDPDAPCQMMRVFVGNDPSNTLRLREQPSNSSRILFLIPNQSMVIVVPTSSEVEAGGYHWLNVIYTDENGTDHIGWAARDANPGFATLTDAGDCVSG
jgi:hypothetical protein